MSWGSIDKLEKVENTGRLFSELSQIGQLSNRRQCH